MIILSIAVLLAVFTTNIKDMSRQVLFGKLCNTKTNTYKCYISVYPWIMLIINPRPWFHLRLG